MTIGGLQSGVGSPANYSGKGTLCDALSVPPSSPRW